MYSTLQRVQLATRAVMNGYNRIYLTIVRNGTMHVYAYPLWSCQCSSLRQWKWKVKSRVRILSFHQHATPGP